MGTVRLGSIRMKGLGRDWRGLAAGVIAGMLAGCADDPPQAAGAPSAVALAAYAEIVAEEDARGDAGLDRVHAHLESADPAVRRMAARALGRLEDPERATAIAALLDDPDPGVRIAAAGALAQSVYGRDPGDALPTLAARAEGEADPAVLGAVATHLGRLAFATEAQREAAATAIADVARRLEAAGGDAGLAGRLGLARGLEAFARGGAAGGSLPAGLVAAATDLAANAPGAADALAAARVRRLAAAALIHTGQLEPDGAAALLADEDWGLRRLAMIWAARRGAGAAATIRAGLGDSDPRVRVEALRAHDEWLRETEGCAEALAALDDPDPDVVATALGSLAEPCSEGEAQRDALAGIVAELDRDDAGWRAPVRALYALAGIAPGEAGDDIRRHARHGNPFVRAWAARAAGRAGEAEVLGELAGDEDPNVSEAALQGLGGVAGGGAADRYRAALQSDDPQLVMNASRLLVEHAPSETFVSILLAPLARFTAARRETERDVRVALLDGIGAVGGFSGEDLAPYLADFDPVVAERAAELLTATTGTVREAAPRPLPLTPPPDAARIAALAGSRVVLHMAGLGEIVVQLRPDLAATNANRFARLARDGYFDGLTFHRVEPNFVIQGGSPHANEYMGDGPYSRDEIGDHPHWRGTVGLSTRGRDTGDAQIFINLVDNVRLDFNYTIYGVVVAGMEVADAVEEGAVIERAEVVGR